MHLFVDVVSCVHVMVHQLLKQL